MMKKKDKSKDGQTPATVSAASAPSEHYERRDGTGFVLVKTLKNGAVVETPLSNFTASIIAELVSVDEKDGKIVDGVIVETRYKDWVKQTRVPVKDEKRIEEYARPFDERLLETCLSIHPLASVAPAKTKAVIDAVKRLSTPVQTIVKNKEKNQPGRR